MSGPGEYALDGTGDPKYQGAPRVAGRLVSECSKCGQQFGPQEAGMFQPQEGRGYHIRCHDEMKTAKLRVYRVTNSPVCSGGQISTGVELADTLSQFDADVGECAYVYPITMSEWDLANLPEFPGH